MPKQVVNLVGQTVGIYNGANSPDGFVTPAVAYGFEH